MGLALGALGFLRVYLWPVKDPEFISHWVQLSTTVLCAVTGVVLWGTISGSMLPFILKRFKLDPASASAPMVATVVDVTGVVIYFSVASFWLRDLLS